MFWTSLVNACSLESLRLSVDHASVERHPDKVPDGASQGKSALCVFLEQPATRTTAAI